MNRAGAGRELAEGKKADGIASRTCGDNDEKSLRNLVGKLPGGNC